MEIDTENKWKVFVDGSCAFCRAVQERVESRDLDHRFLFLDYNDPGVAALAPFPRTQLDAEMHVLGPDGNWRIGFDAWAAVLLHLRFWRWLGAIFSWWPVRLMGRPAYRFIARHRYRLPGMPPPCPVNRCPLPDRMKGFFAAACVALLAASFAAPGIAQEDKIAQTTLKVGDKAPNFTLLDTSWNPVSLNDFHGRKNVIVAFYVLDFTEG
jgi:predicted DCC family thiol-disulfide oxidoreductase YuxK